MESARPAPPVCGLCATEHVRQTESMTPQFHRRDPRVHCAGGRVAACLRGGRLPGQAQDRPFLGPHARTSSVTRAMPRHQPGRARRVVGQRPPGQIQRPAGAPARLECVLEPAGISVSLSCLRPVSAHGPTSAMSRATARRSTTKTALPSQSTACPAALCQRRR